MNIIERIYRADESRKSRFHTASGTLCVDPFELAYAATTTVARATFGFLVKRPWLVGKALPLIEKHVQGARVFEYGAGMSTLWFFDKAESVISVESNAGWAQKINSILACSGKPPAMLLTDAEAYANYIDSVEGLFDIILVDGINRRRCVEKCISKLRKGGLLVLDNTDVNVDLVPEALSAGEFEIKRYSGYAPGVLHPNETTILTKLF